MVRFKSMAQRENCAKRSKFSFEANFMDDDQHFRYEDFFVNCVVKAGRVIDLDFLKSIKFPYLKVFDEFGWTNFVSSKKEVYDELIKAFYSNAVKVGGDCFRTYIMRKEYVINRGIIVDALGMADDGEVYEAYRKHKTLSFAKVVLRKNNLQKVPTYVTVFNMNERLLHLIVPHIVDPSETSYASIQRRDFWECNVIVWNSAQLCFQKAMG
ncbi:hypothetical protein PTKIN_Ptkin03bG0158500 [Pterospermum kingtungense]